MKTQLLEDIGQSTSSLAPSSEITVPLSKKGALTAAPAPSRPRAASGVWRQKPPGETGLYAGQMRDQPSRVREEHEAMAEVADAPPFLNHSTACGGEPALRAIAPNDFLGHVARPDPVFDFSPLSSPPNAHDTASAEPSWFQRSGQRYLLWGTWMLLAALVLQAGWWLYGERKDAGSLQLVAEEFKSEPRQERALRRHALAAKEFTLPPDGEVRVSPAPAATGELQPVRASPPIPPLAVLAPETAASTSAEHEVAGSDGGEHQGGATVAEQDATPEPQSAPERLRQSQGEQFGSDTRPALDAVEPAPDRRAARASAKQVGRTAVQDASMAETLKACRAHGYHAAQCIKRACKVTKYGFACRGR